MSLLYLFERILESGNAYSNMSKMLESLLGPESFSTWTSVDIMSLTLAVGLICIVVMYLVFFYCIFLAFYLYDWFIKKSPLEKWYTKVLYATFSFLVCFRLFGGFASVFAFWFIL